MTTTIKKPLSASGTARVISRILRENGFTKSNTKSRYGQTEGYYVFTHVGYGRTVHVDYHVNKEVRFDNENTRRLSKIAQMREVLFELGYVSSHPHSIHIECQQS